MKIPTIRNADNKLKYQTKIESRQIMYLEYTKIRIFVRVGQN